MPPAQPSFPTAFWYILWLAPNGVVQTRGHNEALWRAGFCTIRRIEYHSLQNAIVASIENRLVATEPLDRCVRPLPPKKYTIPSVPALSHAPRPRCRTTTFPLLHAATTAPSQAMKHPATKTNTAKKHIHNHETSPTRRVYLVRTKRGVSSPHLDFQPPLGKIPGSKTTHIPTPLPHATYLRGEGT